MNTINVSTRDMHLKGKRRKNSARTLLELAQKVQEQLKDANLPADLSQRHDYYGWEEPSQK